MMKRICWSLIGIVIAALTLSGVHAGEKTYKVRSDDSNVSFTIQKWGVFKEEGRFKNYSGVITYDPENPVALAVDFVIQAASIDSRNADRDDVLRSRDFFDARTYPTLSFRGKGADRLGKDSLLLRGDLTIKKVTRSITIPVKVLGKSHIRDFGDLVGFETSFTINRIEYGVGGPRAMLGDDVQIHLIIGAATGATSSARR